MGRLIIVSNRLPFSIEKTSDGLSLRASSGGLVSAINSYFEKQVGKHASFDEKLWIGSVDFLPQEYEEIKDKIEKDKFQVQPIFPEQELYTKYYDGFSNSTIWPLFHYFPSLVEFDKDTYVAYNEINALFANQIASILRQDDVVWIHDYQLMLLPQMLRKLKPEASIGFFLHIPFPSYELIRLLPKSWRTGLLEGILGADLIGFHTHEYVQHFIQSVKMAMKVDNHFNDLQYKNRLVKTDLFPIGIDFEKFNNACHDPTIITTKEQLKQNFSGKKIIFSVDRQDYTKGLMYRLKGFEEFLKSFPEWKEKVVFILNVIPSRNTIKTYIERKAMLEEKISTINGKFSSIAWQPIIYRYTHLPFEELSALYQIADVALITPLRDGMNLVAKEYVASCAKKHGVLILSELTGAASELNEAILVNPTDQEEVAEAINNALRMSSMEKKQRMSFMQDRLKTYDVVRWVTDFLDQLKSTRQEQQKLMVKLLDQKSINRIIKNFNDASNRVLLLDYDGTLSPFTPLPADAVPSGKLLELLSQLSSDNRNQCVIISGRDQQTLETWFGALPVTLVAEHGAAVKYKNKEWEPQIAGNDAWKENIRSIMQLFVARCSGSLIEEKKNTITWHYRNTYGDLGFTRSRELLNNLRQITANTSLQVIDGNKVLEVRQIGVDKGAMALKLVDHFKPEFILCIGDDTTDEDMFKLLEKKAITIKIGTNATAAQFNLLKQEDVLPFLSHFRQLAELGI